MNLPDAAVNKLDSEADIAFRYSKVLVRLVYSAEDVSIVSSIAFRAAACASASVLSLLTSDTMDDVVVAVDVVTEVPAPVVVGAVVPAAVVVGTGVSAVGGPVVGPALDAPVV